MTYATQLARVLSGEEGGRPARTVEAARATVAHYRAACGLSEEEAREVALVTAQIGKAEAERSR